MIRDLLKSLIAELPRYAEEEGDFYAVERNRLVEALCLRHGVDAAIAGNTVSLCECLLDSLAVLRADDLAQGVWCFVSFPAQLLALSVLTAICDADSRLFAANFWNTQGIGNERKDRQREVLQSVEQARFEHHAGNGAQPIRYCYVAWSIVKLDGGILFYQREDTRKRFDKAAGDYGLIGGRANQNDVSAIADKAELLKALQSPDSPLIKNALPATLIRELREEAGLRFGIHYSFQPWRSLKPYRQVQGAAPNHALTEYYLDIFRIELTLEGFLFLRQRIAGDPRLAWLTLADIERGASADHKIPYIKALYDEFAGDLALLVAELAALPDSFVPAYLSAKEKYGVTLPIAPGKPVLAGVLGKEKPLTVSLSARQLSLILGLAAHLRGFEFAALDENIVLHPYGWMEVHAQSPLRIELIELAETLRNHDLPMENHRDSLFRLSITPDTVFFSDELFEFSVKLDDLNGVHGKIPVTIARQAFATAFGPIEDQAESFKLTLEFAHKLKSLSERQFTAENEEAVKIEDTYKKGLHKEARFQALGLRNLVRREDGMIKFVLAYNIC